MSLGAILIGMVLVFLCIPLVAEPLLRKKRKRLVTAGKNAVPLAEQYNETLTKLRDLDFDHTTGKVTDEDYSNLRTELLIQAASELELKIPAEQEADALIENAIRMRRKAATRICSQCGTPQKIGSKFCGSCGATLEPVCQNCGHKINATDLYCTGCGQQLKSMAAPQVEGVQ